MSLGANIRVRLLVVKGKVLFRLWCLERASCRWGASLHTTATASAVVGKVFLLPGATSLEALSLRTQTNLAQQFVCKKSIHQHY